MTDAELREHIETAIREHLPGAVGSNLSAVIAREREESNKHRVAEVKDEKDERERRQRRETNVMRYVVAPLVVAALGGGGFGAYQNLRTPGDIAEAVDARVDSLETTIKGCPNGETCTGKASAESLTGRMEKVEEKTQRLGDLHMGQRELVIDIRDELAEKLDAASPRAAATTPRESINKAREQVEAYKTLKAAKDAEAAMEKGNPFAGIDD